MSEPNRKFKAKLYACGLHKSKNKGTPAVILIAKTKEGHEFPWKGWITENTVDRIVDKLVELGFQGRDIVEVGTRTFAELFPNAPLLDIEIEDNGQAGDDGVHKSYWEIKWINLEGKGGGGFGIIPKERVVQEFGGMNLSAKFMQARKKAGVSAGGGDFNPNAQADAIGSGGGGIENREDLNVNF